MDVLEIKAELFDKLIKIGAMEIRDNFLVINLNLVTVARVFRTVHMVQRTSPTSALRLSESMPATDELLQMPIAEFFSSERILAYAESRKHMVTKIQNFISYYVEDGRAEPMTLDEFTKTITLSWIRRTPNVGKFTINIIVEMLKAVGLRLREI